MNNNLIPNRGLSLDELAIYKQRIYNRREIERERIIASVRRTLSPSNIITQSLSSLNITAGTIAIRTALWVMRFMRRRT